ncbi:MAG TPA: F0F1 ATP synthase subunit delta [Rhodocyclaceae bacterium]
MAELVTIARPYAEAAFRLAQEKKALAAWSQQLELLSAIAADAQMKSCIGNPQLSAPQKSELFRSLAGDKMDGDAARLVEVLAKNERLAVLPQIAELFESLKGEAEGVQDAVIHTAFPLSDAQQKAIVADLEQRYKTRLNAQVVVDQTLIGGVKIVIGDQVLDTSVRGKLDAMATALKN